MLDEFSDRIVITPAGPATHLPKNVFKYMHENFFMQICQPGSADEMSLDKRLMTCQCNGLDFYGMPELSFVLKVDQYPTDFMY